MTKYSSKQIGSAHVIIVVTLVVALVGVLGFLVWQNLVNREPVAKDESTVVNKDERVAKDEMPKIFSVKEYNVEFTIPDELSNTTIKYEERQVGEASFLAFTTQRVVDLGGDCSKGYPFGDLVTLSRGSTPTSDEYQVFTTKEIKGLYYSIGTVESSGLTPESTCPMNELAKNDLNSLVDALKTLAPKK